MVKDNVPFIVLEEPLLDKSRKHIMLIPTLRTFTMSFRSTFFAKAFMSTFPPKPSPSSPSSSSALTPPSTPSPPSLPSLPQNSTKAFSASISLNAFRATEVFSLCHLSNSPSRPSASNPSLVTGNDFVRASSGREEKSVASVGVCASNNDCKLLRCFARSWFVCEWNIRSCRSLDKSERMNRGSVSSSGSAVSQVN